MFQRRTHRTLPQKAREMLWPSMGIKRAALYFMHRLGRTGGSPYAVAAGMANGVAISFTPFIGFHTVLALALCWVTRASMVSALLGTLIAGNFWTLPLALWLSFALGTRLLHIMGHDADIPHRFTVHALEQSPKLYFIPMLAGSLPLFLVSWAVCYAAVHVAILRYRQKKNRCRQLRQELSKGAA